MFPCPSSSCVDSVMPSENFALWGGCLAFILISCKEIIWINTSKSNQFKFEVSPLFIIGHGTMASDLILSNDLVND